MSFIIRAEKTKNIKTQNIYWFFSPDLYSLQRFISKLSHSYGFSTVWSFYVMLNSYCQKMSLYKFHILTSDNTFKILLKYSKYLKINKYKFKIIQSNLKMLKQFYLCTHPTFVLFPIQSKLYIKDKGEKLFSCDTCEKSFPVKSSLTKT